MAHSNLTYGWRQAMPLLIAALVLLVVLFRDTTLFLAGLWMQWEDGGYSHGFLVLLLGIYMVIRDRDSLAMLRPCPSAYALPAVLLCVLIWVLSGLIDVQLVQMVILLPMVLAVIWAIAGWRVMLSLLLPVLFVGLAIPVWAPLQPLLQQATADGAFWLARVAGIPAFLEGFVIQLPSGKLLIEDACSGLHYLLAGITLGVFYAWLNYNSWRERILVVLLAAAASILANILRVFIITWQAHRTDMQHPWVEEHLALGWYLFGALVFLLLLVDLLVGRHVQVTKQGPSLSPPDCGHAAFTRFMVLSVTVLFLVAGSLAPGWMAGQVPAAAGQSPILPNGNGLWTGPFRVNTKWAPQFHGALPVTGAYRRDGETVHVYIGYYDRQEQGRELINALNRIADEEYWQINEPAVTVEFQPDKRVAEVLIESPVEGRYLVWYRYRVAGKYTISEVKAKLFQAAGVLSGQTDAGIVALATEAGRDLRGARQRLKEFMLAVPLPLSATMIESN